LTACGGHRSEETKRDSDAQNAFHHELPLIGGGPPWATREKNVQDPCRLQKASNGREQKNLPELENEG
jgi:hypothetical protein